MDIKELKTKKVSAISLGCDKNRVDLEKMLYNIKKFGLEVIPEVELSQIVIVNTCSFIAPAVDEAIQNILEVLDLKNSGVEKVIVTGCLVSRYKDQIKSSIPNVDAFVDIKDNDKIVSTILNLYNLEEKYNWTNGRLLTNLPHFAYLKIADGCDNCCSYCTIPRIRGRY
ncbi:MAG: 30S ribosomal protein S12 methylthiotransferase RimO, partial [Clostridia bacterium]|nr:30S ribosomal protein S12 methylthiotransferase RimO [Clostridia bacterium]